MTEKVVKLSIFCDSTVHGIVSGDEQAGVEVGLQQNMKIEKGIERIKRNKKQGID